MSGWKTILAGVGAIIYGIVLIIANGDFQAGIELIIAGLAVLGIGHKLDKNSFIIKKLKEVK